ncbi:VanW family protein [Salisediminibacterium halotolerans]|uniref:VanW family protein n=1 Tax=Salisediminibacterium halotolerans TaxID=517425 RepID=UPI000F108ECF|nr:VanW family protein [Salisediminibacterium halotolerans]RLJ78234.1 VanW like protein [Actinophytocola xinjiangensis]RPE88427.1 VanW like protein [Salisediminibacterium halotolerans]TWG37211.1 VanW like protein [Salisediminibacterium halotolerans]GEL07145.1 hypothetical protein SHA02_05610 [Salisediminibacterium halotolerans]
MEKQKWFAGVFAAITGIAVFLTLFTYAGSATYAHLFGEEHFSEDRQIASADVSGMSVSEAETHIEKQAQTWINESDLVLQWFDEQLTVSDTIVDIDAEETVNEALTNDGAQSGLVSHVEEDSLAEEVSRFTGLANFTERVDLPSLKAAIKAELSAAPASAQISLHDHKNPGTAPGKTIVARAERDAALDGEASEWIGQLGEFTIEANSSYSFRDMLNEQGIVYHGGENAAVLSSAVFETFVQSNFDIVERHIRHERFDAVPLGYDAAVTDNGKDLQAENVNDTSYTLRFDSTPEGFAVELEGYDWPYAIETGTKTEEQIEYDTRVRFDDQLPPGTAESIKDGKEGEFIRLTRSFLDEADEVIREETVSEDFYAPQHALIARSTEEAPEEPPAEEPAERGLNGGTGEAGGEQETDAPVNGQPDRGERPEVSPPASDRDAGENSFYQEPAGDESDDTDEEDTLNRESGSFQPGSSGIDETDERPLKGR